MKIFDTFLFLNELDLLEIRLNILNSHVDYFIINESPKTFSGKFKPLYYEDNKERFSKFKDKIIHNIIEIPEELGSCWDREIFQRNASISKLKEFCDPDDVVITSDLDEIPNPEILENIDCFFDKNNLYHLKQNFYMYYINNYVTNNWFGSRICSFEYLKNTSIDDIRQATEDENKLNGFVIENGGWHFTYLGGEERIKQKIESFSHQEYNNPNVKNNISNSLNQNIDIFGRNKQFKVFDLTEENFPKYIVENKDKYADLIKL
jgi:beta-1,4-mannosyl-glycoprotein beta-1,4-N-acetylglucosaminyltransferase